MSNLFGVLRTGQYSLRTASYKSQIASENLSGANQPGYVKRTIMQTPIGATAMRPSANADAGPNNAFAIENYPAFLGGMHRNQLSSNAKADARAGRLAAAAALFPGIGDASIPAAVTNYFDAWRGVAADPADRTARSVLITNASALTNLVSQKVSWIARERGLVSNEVNQVVDRVNALGSFLAGLNQKIVAGSSSDGDTSALRASRREALEELAGLIDTTVLEQENGSMTILTAGNRELVTGNQVYELTSVPTNATVGKLAGLISYRDNELASIATQLDTFVYDFVGAVNSQHQAGYDLNGGQGGEFFAALNSASGAAGSFSVTVTDPDLVAASSSATLSLDNTNALAMAELETTNLASGVQPWEAAFSVARYIGVAYQEAQGAANAGADLADGLERRIREESGVDPDEEAVNLVEAQRSYEAAARIIQAADSMLETLLNLAR